MFCRLQAGKLLFWCVLCVGAFGVSGGCGTGHYKAQADKEVYDIIDAKWQQDFGEKANYTIAGVEPSPNDVRIEHLMAESGVMCLADVVAIATAQNREYQRQKELLYLVSLDLTLERHQFARQWFGTIDSAYVKGTEDGSYEESVGSDGKLGFDQLLAGGAVVSTNIALDWSRFLTGDPRTSLGSVLSASLTQPLLRGRGRRIVQEKLTQAERNALYQIRMFSRFRKTFVVSIVTDYYRVLQLRDAVDNAWSNYERRLESKKRLKLEAEVGRRPLFELDQAEQNVFRARDACVRAGQKYEQQLDEFKMRLALPADVNVTLDQNELEALREVGVAQPDYLLHAAVETALLRRLDLANSWNKIDDAARKVIVAADGLGAELNLIGSATVHSTERTEFDRLRFHRGSYALGLEADLPLDRKAERNAYRESLIALEQAWREYENDADQTELDVREAYRGLGEAAERYQIQNNSLELASRRVESTSLLLEEGRASTRDLLEAQDALIRAQDDVTAALVDHAVAKLSFFRDIGVLEVRPDGMPAHSNRTAFETSQ